MGQQHVFRLTGHPLLKGEGDWYCGCGDRYPVATRSKARELWQEHREAVVTAQRMKECEFCGATMHKGERRRRQWLRQRYCSLKCMREADRFFLISETEWLLDGGAWLEGIPARLGYQDLCSLRNALVRNGRRDLADRLHVEPKGWVA